MKHSTPKWRNGVRGYPLPLAVVSGVLLVGAAAFTVAGLALMLSGPGSVELRACMAGAAALVLAGGLAFGVFNGLSRDRKLAWCPRLREGDEPIVRVKPIIGAAFAAWAVGAVVCLAATVIGAVGHLDSKSQPAGDAGSSAATAERLLMLGLCPVFLAISVTFLVWLWMNRGRDFLWLSGDGIGYLPDRVDDDGYLPWCDVVAVRCNEQATRGIRTGQRWIITSVSKPPVTVATMAGVRPRPDVLVDVIAELAPHVTTEGR